MRLSIAFSILLLTAQTALAQSGDGTCPGLDASAGADKEVLCWFDREQSGAEECVADNEGVSVCARQIATWCPRAVLDDPAVANACFLAHVRAGRLDNALLLDRYLQSPTVEVVTCRQALRGITAKFASIPSGAELLVDGQSYGKTPVEVKLRSQWWKSKVVARFGAGDGATEVDISRQDLTRAFDRRACAMAEDVVVKGPEAASLAPSTQTSQSSAVEEAPAEKRSGVSVPAVVTMALGGAGLITGGILLAIAASRYSDLKSLPKDTTWNTSLRDKDESVKPLSIGGFAALGAGAALATVGVILLVMSSDSSPERAVDAANRTLRFTGQAIQWAGTF
jgi:hypothetical protein